MRAMLLRTAQSFCTAFSTNQPVTSLIPFFTEHEATVIEHGDPTIAPFLGREFIGHSEIQKYFSLVNDLLESEKVEFTDYFVDPGNYKIFVRGKGKWKWKGTGKAWEEEIAYLLEFAEGLSEGEDEERELRLTRWDVWADTGALLMAQQK